MHLLQGQKNMYSKYYFHFNKIKKDSEKYSNGNNYRNPLEFQNTFKVISREIYSYLRKQSF